MDRQAKKLQVVREEEARFGTDAFVDEDPDDTEVRDIFLGETHLQNMTSSLIELTFFTGCLKYFWRVFTQLR